MKFVKRLLSRKKSVADLLAKKANLEGSNFKEDNIHLNLREVSMDFNEGLSAGTIASALADIYLHLYQREWMKIVPPVTSFQDGEFLYNVDYTYVKLHRIHKKFGEDIIEYGVSYLKNSYCFFDYSRLEVIFEWFDHRGDWEISTAPPVPTYYAVPSDRYCYGTERQEWED